MALEHRCVSIGGPSTYTLIHIATCACTRTSATRTTAAHASTTDRAQSAAVRARAGSGAYPVQRRDSRGVPRADVRVEGRRLLERLRARTMEACIRIHVYIQRGKGLCVCALDIDKLGCRGSSMALEHTCVSIGDPSTYTVTRRATCARAHAHIGGAATAQKAAHASATDRAQSAAVRAGPEAAHTEYESVTRAVFHAPMFALKADAW